jgi:hypothetical protein
MAFAIDSIGFGHGRCGKGPCGHGPWITFPWTPGYPFLGTQGFAVDAVTFEDLTEQRILRAQERGTAFTYAFPHVDSATHTAMGSWVQGTRGAATRYVALEHRTGLPYVVRQAGDAWDVSRGAGTNRDTTMAFQAERDVTYAAQVMADSPVAYWRMGEATGVSTLTDVTGNSFHAVIAAGVTLQECGALVGDWDRALRVTSGGGTAGHVRVGSLGLGDAFTAEWWFRHTEPDSIAEHAIVAWGGGGLGAWWIKILNGAISTHQNSTGTVYFQSTFPYADNAWHHMAWARSAAGVGNGTVYIDGSSAPGTTANSIRTPSVVSLSLFSFNGAQGFNGYVDEVAIYNYALTADRVLAHYRAGRRQ